MKGKDERHKKEKQEEKWLGHYLKSFLFEKVTGVPARTVVKGRGNFSLPLLKISLYLLIFPLTSSHRLRYCWENKY